MSEGWKAVYRRRFFPKIFFCDKFPDHVWEFPELNYSTPMEIRGRYRGLYYYPKKEIWLQRSCWYGVLHELIHWIAYEIGGRDCPLNNWLHKFSEWVYRKTGLIV